MYLFLQTPFLLKSRKWNWCLHVFGVYRQRKFASEDSFVFLWLSSAADAVQILLKLTKQILEY